MKQTNLLNSVHDMSGKELIEGHDDNHVQQVVTDQAMQPTESCFSDKLLGQYDVEKEASPSGKLQQITKTSEELRQEVEDILNACFKDREFNIAEFAELENVEGDCDIIKNSDIFNDEFDRTREVVSQLLDATASDSAVGGEIAIRLSYDEIIDAYNRVASNHKPTSDDTAYKLYKEFGNLIRIKMADAEKSRCAIQNKRVLDDRLWIIDQLQDAKMKKADAILGQNFSGKMFDFEKFAKINGIVVDPYCKPHSNSIQNGFKKMYIIACSLLRSGITVDKGMEGSVTIKLTADEVINARNRVARSCRLTPNDKAYKLYSELGNLIHGKLLHVVQDDFFIKNQKNFATCLSTSYNLCKSFLLLPLVNFDGGMELCKRMIKTCLIGQLSVHNLSVDTLSDAQKLSPEYQDLVKEFQKLGVFFAFKNMELGKQALLFLKTIASLGMKLPLFMAEITTPGRDLVQSFSNDFVGVAIHEGTANLQFRGLPESRRHIAHEITHHARSAVGALFIDRSIAHKNLSDVLKGHDDVISAIKSQISDYALIDYEEYIACFGALVLCCLSVHLDPFYCITDPRLWRLYYEFGGPDFMFVINEHFVKPKFGRDILSDPSLNWLPGYPSKFGVDINQIKDQQIIVAGLVAVGILYYVNIYETSILPPPPLGYCYTTKNGNLQLKVDKNILPSCQDDQCYDPIFCVLTHGSLTLMYAEDRSDPNNPKPLQHHFEALPKENSSALEILTGKSLAFTP